MQSLTFVVLVFHLRTLKILRLAYNEYQLEKEVSERGDFYVLLFYLFFFLRPGLVRRLKMLLFPAPMLPSRRSFIPKTSNFGKSWEIRIPNDKRKDGQANLKSKYQFKLKRLIYIYIKDYTISVECDTI